MELKYTKLWWYNPRSQATPPKKFESAHQPPEPEYSIYVILIASEGLMASVHYSITAAVQYKYILEQD